MASFSFSTVAFKDSNEIGFSRLPGTLSSFIEIGGKGP
jgi:hypothetical protein